MFAIHIHPEGTCGRFAWQGVQGVPLLRQRRGLDQRLLICGMMFLCSVSNSPVNDLPCPASRCPMKSDAALFHSSLLTSQKTHYEGSGHPRTSVSLHPLPSRVAAHTKHALTAHDVFQSCLSPKPSAKNKLVKSCFSQKDGILSCLPLQDNCS